jgi:hypothetical protein
MHHLFLGSIELYSTCMASPYLGVYALGVVYLLIDANVFVLYAVDGMHASG